MWKSLFSRRGNSSTESSAPKCIQEDIVVEQQPPLKVHIGTVDYTEPSAVDGLEWKTHCQDVPSQGLVIDSDDEALLLGEFEGTHIAEKAPPSNDSNGACHTPTAANESHSREERDELPLENVVFLATTTMGDDPTDSVSVISDGLTDEESIVEGITELGKALEALEGEARINGASSPSTSVSAHSELASRLGLSTDNIRGNPLNQLEQNAALVKLYNNLALKLMDLHRRDGRDYEQAAALLTKAEAILDSDTAWHREDESKNRLRAITCNNFGCLMKRKGQPAAALPYLATALALEELSGNIQNTCSTLLNLCASTSALRRYKEALGYAERAIVLLQKDLWSKSGSMSFQGGLMHLARVMVPTNAARPQLLSLVQLLAMAYHNAAVEHERLGKLREAAVSFARAATLADRFLGPKMSMTTALHKAHRAYQLRQGKALGGVMPPNNAPHTSRRTASSLNRVTSRAAVGSHRVRNPSPKRARSGLSKSASATTLAVDKGRLSAASSQRK